MSNKSKVITTNLSSIADFKAELLRKQEELRKKKSINNDATQPATSAESVPDESNDDYLYNRNLHKISRLPKKMTDAIEEKKASSKSKNKQESKDDESKKQEESVALQKSREMLEKKTQLYNQLCKGRAVIDPENQDDLLVNFDLKARQEEENESEEEMVEIEDEFGRTKRVPKSSLPPKNTETRTEDQTGTEKWSMSSGLLSEDMKREIERRNWEQETEEELQQNKSLNVHYENVKNGEIRDHGVAYYAFSQDEETRNKQLEMLKNMSKETELRKQEKQKIKEKRKQIMKSRLAKVAARKGIAMPVEEEDSDSDHEQITIHKSTLKTIDEKPKLVNLREWDIGKEGVYSSLSQSTNYVDKKRSERNDEFAPPSLYSESSSRPRNRDESYKKFRTHHDSFQPNDTKPFNENQQFAPPSLYNESGSRYQEESYKKLRTESDDFEPAAVVSFISEIRKNTCK